MLALDTNVLVRFLVCDDEAQATLVLQLFKKTEKRRERLFVSLLVVLESIWVLESAYGKPRSEIIQVFAEMLQMPVLAFESEDVIERFLNDAASSKVDLSDILIARSSEAAGCDACLTFDKAASKLAYFKLLH